MAIRPLHNEQELLVKIAGGDQRAFTELFEGYGRPLGAFVLKLTGSLEMTEEIVQDSFVKVWLKRESLLEIDNFSGYLYILCRNHAFAMLKKMANERVHAGRVEEHLLEEMDFEGLDNPAEEYRKQIEEAVSRLPEQQQKVYRLSRYQRLKHEQIAAELGLSSETVKKHIQLAVSFIRREVGNGQNMGAIVVLTSSFLVR